MLPFVYPMDNHSVITLFQRMLNHVDTRLVDHGFRVAAHADHMLQELYPDCDPLIRRNLILTALLHDIGANKTDEIDNLLNRQQLAACHLRLSVFAVFFTAERLCGRGFVSPHQCF